MADLTANDVAVSAPAGKRNIMGLHSVKNVSLLSVTFGDGSKTYPTGGIPMPSLGQFGYKKALDFVAVEQPPGNGYVYKFDRTNHKMLIYTQGMKTGATAAADVSSGALAKNSAGTETALRLMGTAINTTYDTGAMIELPATNAPAAVTLNLMMLGE